MVLELWWLGNDDVENTIAFCENTGPMPPHHAGRLRSLKVLSC